MLRWVGEMSRKKNYLDISLLIKRDQSTEERHGSLFTQAIGNHKICAPNFKAIQAVILVVMITLFLSACASAERTPVAFTAIPITSSQLPLITPFITQTSTIISTETLSQKTSSPSIAPNQPTSTVQPDTCEEAQQHISQNAPFDFPGIILYTGTDDRGVFGLKGNPPISRPILDSNAEYHIFGFSPNGKWLSFTRNRQRFQGECEPGKGANHNYFDPR